MSECYFWNWFFLLHCLSHPMLPVQCPLPVVISILANSKITLIPNKMLLFKFIILLQWFKSCYFTSAMYIFCSKFYHDYCYNHIHPSRMLLFNFIILLQCSKSCYIINAVCIFKHKFYHDHCCIYIYPSRMLLLNVIILLQCLKQRLYILNIGSLFEVMISLQCSVHFQS